jgi:nickel/cobalt transporter (NicO) family protein
MTHQRLRAAFSHLVTLSPCHLVIALLALVALTPAARAHPIPRDNHDRTIVVRLTPEAVVVDYRLEVDELRAVEDMPREELHGLDPAKGFHRLFLDYHAPVLANNLDATLDGKALTFTCVARRFRVLDHLRCDFRFRAPWKLAPGGQHAFTFREGNYHDDDFSALRLSLLGSSLLTLRDVVAPGEELATRPPDRLGPGERDERRSASATVLATPSVEVGSVKSGVPPGPEPPRRPPRLRDRPAIAVTKPPPEGPVASARTIPPPPEEEGDGEEEATDGGHSLLRLLFDTRQGLGVLLLLAAAFGAAHALTPGHGKTLVAAYLIGERGTVGHALLLGLVTTLTHTGAVLALAALLPLLFPRAVPATVQMTLGLVGGLLIAGLGFWLLLRRLSGQVDHVHLGGGHHHHHHDHGHAHHHGHEHHHAVPVRPGVWGLVVLGVSGGIVPCWDAIAMLGLAISAQRLWLGLPLLLAFSAGLAGVLIALGVVVVHARKLAVNTWGEGPGLRRVARTLPLVSAVVITALGLWLCFESVRAAGAPPPAASARR